MHNFYETERLHCTPNSYLCHLKATYSEYSFLNHEVIYIAATQSMFAESALYAALSHHKRFYYFITTLNHICIFMSKHNNKMHELEQTYIRQYGLDYSASSSFMTTRVNLQ